MSISYANSLIIGKRKKKKPPKGKKAPKFLPVSMYKLPAAPEMCTHNTGEEQSSF